MDADGPFPDYKAKLFESIMDKSSQSQTQTQKQRPVKKIQRFNKTRRQIAQSKLQFSTNSQRSNMLEPMSDAASMRGNMEQRAPEEDEEQPLSGTSHNSDSEMMTFEEQEPKEENEQENEIASDAEMD